MHDEHEERHEELATGEPTRARSNIEDFLRQHRSRMSGKVIPVNGADPLPDELTQR
jgi:hypothetical protein